jgi:ribulose-phosphate 3-epimerase
MIDIIPGILESEFSEIEYKVGLVAPYVEWVQIDFSDGTLVPGNTCMHIEKFQTLCPKYPNVSFEAHLMVTKPEKYIRGLATAGFKRLIAHVEADDTRIYLAEVEYESVEVGLAIDGTTEVGEIEPFLEKIDTVLVMTVEAGASGQKFLPETVEKIKAIHEGYPDLPIEVDGGINDVNIKIVKDAGATRAVMTSYIFTQTERIAKAIARLKNA